MPKPQTPARKLKPRAAHSKAGSGPTKPAATQSRTIALAISGLEVPVEIRRHRSARRLTLRINQTRRAVVVTVPLRCKIDEAGSFVNRHLDWVRTRLRALPSPIPFEDGIIIPVRGTDHIVRFVGPRLKGAVVEFEQLASGMPVLEIKGVTENAPRRLRDWLYAEARRDLDQRVAFHAHRLGLRARRLSVRDQGSRWGSCSTSGMLSFSWRLILAPPIVLDYVAAHEVAHLAEMNHGPRFWALVRRTMPDMDVAKAWLLKHGQELHRYDGISG
jgi:predicted metal-dependent hydrolase